MYDVMMLSKLDQIKDYKNSHQFSFKIQVLIGACLHRKMPDRSHQIFKEEGFCENSIKLIVLEVPGGSGEADDRSIWPIGIADVLNNIPAVYSRH